MVKGGYKIINLKGVELDSGVAKTVKGVYESLENNYGKATMLSGLNIDGKVYGDMYVNFVVADTDYVATTYLGTVTISDDDTVTFNASSGSTQGGNGSIG